MLFYCPLSSLYRYQEVVHELNTLRHTLTDTRHDLSSTHVHSIFKHTMTFFPIYPTDLTYRSTVRIPIIWKFNVSQLVQLQHGMFLTSPYFLLAGWSWCALVSQSHLVRGAAQTTGAHGGTSRWRQALVARGDRMWRCGGEVRSQDTY